MHDLINRLTILESNVSWRIPTTAELEMEYKYEYMLPSRNWDRRCETIGAPYPLFDDFADFTNKIQHSTPSTINKGDHVYNMTDYRTVDQVTDLVSSYQFPRDVDRILDGFKQGASLPMPIIIEGSKGRWILSGNTRTNLAHIMGIPVTALVYKSKEI